MKTRLGLKNGWIGETPTARLLAQGEHGIQIRLHGSCRFARGNQLSHQPPAALVRNILLVQTLQ